MSEMDRLLKAVNEVEHLLCEDEELLGETLETLKKVAKHNGGHSQLCDECNQTDTAITVLEERLK